MEYAIPLEIPELVAVVEEKPLRVREARRKPRQLSPEERAEFKRLRKFYSSSQKAKLERLAEWLREASENQVSEYIGTHPDVVAVVAGHMVIASIEYDERPSLEILDKDFALRWHDAIVDYLTDPEVDEDMRDICYAVNETRPSE